MKTLKESSTEWFGRATKMHEKHVYKGHITVFMGEDPLTRSRSITRIAKEIASDRYVKHHVAYIDAVCNDTRFANRYGCDFPSCFHRLETVSPTGTIPLKTLVADLDGFIRDKHVSVLVIPDFDVLVRMTGQRLILALTELQRQHNIAIIIGCAPVRRAAKSPLTYSNLPEAYVSYVDNVLVVDGGSIKTVMTSEPAENATVPTINNNTYVGMRGTTCGCSTPNLVTYRPLVTATPQTLVPAPARTASPPPVKAASSTTTAAAR